MAASTDTDDSISNETDISIGTGTGIGTGSGITRSLRRAVGLLRLLSTHTQIGWRLTDLAERGALDRAIVHRLLAGLCDERLGTGGDVQRRRRWRPGWCRRWARPGWPPDADGHEARTLRPRHAAAVTYRIAFGPRAGQKVLTVRGAMARDTDFEKTLCADIDGFSLHAAVRCGADDRQGLEQLCRYISRPALAHERAGAPSSATSWLSGQVLGWPWAGLNTGRLNFPCALILPGVCLVTRARPAPA